ncbi:MAG: hypothetical protein AAF215_25350 [Cyanobacteria bacterium P01_A01_bin.123]
MNSDSEMIQSLLLWLLEEPGSSISKPSGSSASSPSGKSSQANEAPAVDAREEGAADYGSSGWDPLNSEELSSLPPEVVGPDLVAKTYSFFDLGDIPAVQDRFQALLKRKLQTEIERRPPLFPWESEVQEYPIDLPVLSTPETVWMAQLRSLNLPTTLPDTVLTALLSRCQAIAATPLQQGLKLIKAVESLFPDQPQTLNLMADMVLANAGTHRSTVTSAPMASLSTDYEGANPQQQIALSMLAAQEILANLSISLSAEQPQRMCTWVTAHGLLQVEATYTPDSQQKQVDLRVHLPLGGTVQLQGQEVAAAAQRSGAGYLNLGISDPQPSQAYTLQIKLTGAEQEPLRFNLQVVSDSDQN